MRAMPAPTSHVSRVTPVSNDWAPTPALVVRIQSGRNFYCHSKRAYHWLLSRSESIDWSTSLDCPPPTRTVQ